MIAHFINPYFNGSTKQWDLMITSPNFVDMRVTMTYPLDVDNGRMLLDAQNMVTSNLLSAQAQYLSKNPPADPAAPIPLPYDQSEIDSAELIIDTPGA